MKFLIAVLLFTSFAHASYYDMNVTCGEIKSAGNGKILKRLQPSVFGINSKYVLKTKFRSYVEINETGFKIPSDARLDLVYDNQTSLTYFSDKDKFLSLKKELKDAIKKSKKKDEPLYACVGRIEIYPLKYKGSQVFTSTDSVEDALRKARKLVKKHL